MYKLINGYTKESMKEIFKKNNIGKPALYQVRNGDNDNWHEHVEEGEVINEYCVYFNPVDGNRCAVGCFIPDDFIEKNRTTVTDEIDAVSLLTENPSLIENMPLHGRGITAFQEAHDCYNEKKTSLSFHDYMCEWIDNNCED